MSIGRTDVHLHCDNCSGQNENKYVLWYMAWRTIHKLHHFVTLNFMISGHTKFGPDWCFGLRKQKYRHTCVLTLQDIADVATASSVKDINTP